MKNLILVSVLFLLAWSSSSQAAGPTRVNNKTAIMVEGPIIGGLVAHILDELALAETNKVKTVQMVFDSPGGSLHFGYLVVDRMESLRRQGVHFECFVRTLAASMAFQMFLHCDERYAAPHALVLWHPVRVFWQGPLTEKDARITARQIGEANKAVLADLREHLPMSKKDLLWHYENETLHHAASLDKLAPGFFREVSNDIVNLYSTEPSTLPGEKVENSVGSRDILYIHESFIISE